MDELLPEVLPVRAAARALVRELGFLQAAIPPEDLPPSHCHALIEIECGALNQSELAERLRLDKSTTSRVVARLASDGLVSAARDADDRRQAVLGLTAAGRSRLARIHESNNRQVQAALSLLGDEQRAQVLIGLSVYARALGRARRRQGLVIRPIRVADDRGIERVIRTVMPEFGASGPGFAIQDPEVGHMSRAYRRAGHAYFVVVEGEEVVGGGGIAPLEGGPAETCELRKMYFLPRVRGLGLGQELMARCLAVAREQGYRRCYLETLRCMGAARALYERNGFQLLTGPEGNTGHFGCDMWYARQL
jgi:putative acetyltransferase